MKKLNLNQNNNKYVQMKQSGLDERSYYSEHSDVLSLTSNNTENMVNNSQNQIELFKQKISYLLGTDKPQSLQDLYCTIKQKVGTKLIQQTSQQLNGMQTALGRVKKNNRQMSKLVTVLGNKSQKQDTKLNKKEYKRSVDDKNQKKYKNSDRQSQEQFYSYQYKNSQRNKDRQNSQQQKEKNQRIRYLNSNVKQSFEQEYRWKNRIYQQKVKQMLMQLGNIKKELNINQSNNNSNKNNTQIKKDNKQIRNSFDSRLKLQQQKQTQSHKKQIDIAFNPKTAVSEEINVENIDHYLTQDKIQGQTKKYHYKNSIETTNSQSNNKITNKITNVIQGNTFLIQKAKSISKRLQQIKAELTQTTSRIPLHSITQTGQKTNIQLLASNNFNTQKNNIYPQSYKKDQLGQKSIESLQQKIIQNDSNQYNEKEEHPVSIQRLEQQPLPKHKLTKKKSVLDQMKNVQSKILISEKHIQGSSKWDSLKSHKRVQTPNFSTLYNPNLPSQAIPKPNILTSLTKSNDKPLIVSYSVLNPSNSYKNLPHNTSIMNYRPPINKQQSINLRNSFINNTQLGPYETSHVFPVTKFNKHKMFQNQSLQRSPSINRIQYPPLIIQQPQSQNIGPIMNRSGSNIKIGRSLSQKKLSNHSLNLSYQNIPAKIVTSPGIRITNLEDNSKLAPYIVSLGSSKKQRRSSTSKDSKDLTRSKGINLYSKQNQ